MPTLDAKLSLGQFGEECALGYLRQNGYQLVAKNFRLHPYGEIDLIVYKDKTLVFVEVKTRQSRLSLDDRGLLNHQKLLKVRRVAQLFLAQQKSSPVCQSYRIDVILVRIDACKKSTRARVHLEHHPNLWSDQESIF